MMPGRKASCAWPERRAKNAATAVAITAEPRNRQDPPTSWRATTSTTSSAAEAMTAVRTESLTSQVTTNATVGSAVSSDPYQPPSASLIRRRMTCSTVTSASVAPLT
jgi:hypothetical protein